MLSERIRNYAVGLTMIAAIAAFMVAVFRLGDLAAYSHGRPYAVALTAPNAGGVVAGTTVNFNGVIIGSVASVNLSKDFSQVEMILSIQPDVLIPSNAVVQVGKPATLGTANVSFVLPEETTASGAATTAAPAKPLPVDGTGRVVATALESGLIPKKTTDTLTAAANDISLLARHLTATADGLNELLAKRTLAEYNAMDPKTRTANISVLVQQVNQAVEDVHGLIGDPKTRDQIHSILENVASSAAGLKETLAQFNAQVAAVSKSATGTLDKFGTSADQISAAATQASGTLRTTEAQLVRTTEQLSTTLAALQATMDSINKGNGTAGRLVNDPRLYDGLVDLTTSLKKTSDDLNTLIQKWKEEGLPLHLK